ncbi:transposase, partial [Paraburkholderia sp. BR14427]|uniref:IS66 family transposase n=1 Tax=Paraburkholderia sp. BR14427 TaxID=3237008 RepID=UPI0034CF6D5B
SRTIRTARSRTSGEYLGHFFFVFSIAPFSQEVEPPEIPGRFSSAIAKALDYSLKRWEALTRYLDDGHVPIDNNWVENQIRPWAIGRANWLFAGSLRAGQRAAAIMSLLRSAQLNGHEPHAYLKDVLTRLPTHRASDVATLLPHRWQPTVAVA